MEKMKKIRYLFIKDKEIYSILFQVTIGILLFFVTLDIFQPVPFKTAITSFVTLPCLSTNSMYHFSNFENWWLPRRSIYHLFNITKEEFKKYPFHNGLESKEILIEIPTNIYKKGDVLVFMDPQNRSKGIIHRLVYINTNNSLIFMGDNNLFPVPNSDYYIPKENIKGKIIAKVPFGRYIRRYIQRGNDC